MARSASSATRPSHYERMRLEWDRHTLLDAGFAMTEHKKGGSALSRAAF